MIATFLGLVCCAFSIPLLIASGVEMRRYKYDEADYDYSDPWVWWTVSLTVLVIGCGLLFY